MPVDIDRTQDRVGPRRVPMTLILVGMPRLKSPMKEEMAQFRATWPGSVLHFGELEPKLWRDGDSFMLNTSSLWHIPDDDIHVAGVHADACIWGVMWTLQQSGHHPKLIKRFTETLYGDTEEYLNTQTWEMV